VNDDPRGASLHDQHADSEERSGRAELGWVAEDVAAEFPELGLRFLELPAVRGRSRGRAVWLGRG